MVNKKLQDPRIELIKGFYLITFLKSVLVQVIKNIEKNRLQKTKDLNECITEEYTKKKRMKIY